MSLDATNMESESGPVAVPVTNRKVRLLTLSSLDKRTAAYRKAADLISSTESDLGGVETMTTAERQLVQRASLLGAWAESMETQWLSGETVDPALICTIAKASCSGHGSATTASMMMFWSLRGRARLSTRPCRIR